MSEWAADAFRLDGRVALVTGGSKGIGLGIAHAMTAAGATVVISSRKADACEAAAAEVGGGCGWVAGNAGDPDDIARVVQTTVDRHGGVDILVNNAATNPYAGPTLGIDLGRWEKTLQVNLTGPLLLCQAVWNASMAERGGSIINVSSVGGLSPTPMIGPYDVTKAALLHLTRQLAAELGPGVRVNVLAPGLVRTEFARALWDGDRGDRTAERYPLKRLGVPADIAYAAVYLASAASGWMTGQTLVVDGGDTVAF